MAEIDGQIEDATEESVIAVARYYMGVEHDADLIFQAAVCGAVQFYLDEFEDEDLQDIVDRAGELIKKGMANAVLATG